MSTQTLFSKAFTFAAFATAASYAGSAAAAQQAAPARNVPEVRPVSALGQDSGHAVSGGLLHLTAQ
ncbi:MAG: hypothetical protein V4505_21110 [Pseudomonadota bacterium]